ncbi:MAG TPA: hypothetical protein VFY91_01220 [Microbacterium sp.]|nr:hypothetical protein [Microbacterium sp.]
MLGLFISPPATAAPPETTTEHYSFEAWDCGYPMQVEGQFTSTLHERSNPRGGELPLRMENVRYAETWTNSDGDSFELFGRLVSRDAEITPLGGSLYEITLQQSGQPQVVTAGGSVIARDRGNLRLTFRTDIETGAFEFLGVRLSGPHPGFDADLCKIVAPVVGTDSAQRHTPHPLGTTDAPLGYYEYLPPSYGTGAEGSPLLIHTNGYGENGDGSAEALGNLLFTSIPRFIDVGGWPLERPFVVLSTQHVPQAGVPGLDPCAGVPWFGSCAMQLQHDLGHPPESGCTTPDEIHDFVAYAIDHYDVDPSRVYVTGLSCGAFGIWEYLAEHGDAQVAAAVPIAGEGRPAWATAGCALGAVPIWAIHGELDEVVNPAGSIEPITSLQQCPGVAEDQAKLSIYPGVFHDSWDAAYSGSAGDDIYSWMLGFTRG